MIRTQAMERLSFIWPITSFESSRIIDSCRLHKHFMNKHEAIDRALAHLFFQQTDHRINRQWSRSGGRPALTVLQPLTRLLSEALEIQPLLLCSTRHQ